MFSVDGSVFTFPCDIERMTTIEYGDNSGMVLNGNIRQDPIGSYLSYTVTIVVPFGQEQEYSVLYEILNQPVAEHTFNFPYNQTTITFKGYIETIADKYFKQINGATVWRGIKFEVSATEPYKAAI